MSRYHPAELGSGVRDGTKFLRDDGTWQPPGGAFGGFAAPGVTWATTNADGVAGTAIRTDAQFRYPTGLMSVSPGTGTLIITDDGVDQTLTGSLGNLNIRTASDAVSLPLNVAGANGVPSPDTVMRFSASLSPSYPAIRTGLDALQTLNGTGSYTGQNFISIRGQISMSGGGGATHTGTSLFGAQMIVGGINMTTTSTFTAIYGGDLSATPPGESGAGAVTVTDLFGARIRAAASAAAIIGNPSVTNAYGIQTIMPCIGGTIRRGISVETQTGNKDADPASVEGVFVGALQRGTADRRVFAGQGATTGTPTNTVILDQTTVHSVGTNRYFLRGLNRSSLSNPSGLGDTVLELRQLNTGATAGAHLNLDDKAGNPGAPNTGDLWRNADALNFRKAASTVDLALRPIPIADGGTGQTTATAAFNALDPLTTKGDLLAHDGTDSVRLAVGTDTHVLTADSTQASGVKWAAAPGAAGGDAVSVNGSAATDADFDDLAPAAPTTGVGSFTGLNVRWQITGASPSDISSYVGKDSAGNWMLGFLPAASAVNFIAIGNGATGTGPRIFATGTDSNVDLRLTGRGSTGRVMISPAGLNESEVTSRSMFAPLAALAFAPAMA